MANRALIAGILGLALTLAAATKLPYLELLATPGVFVAASLGMGTIHEPGSLGLGALAATIWVATFLVWSMLAYAVLALRKSRDAA